MEKYMSYLLIILIVFSCAGCQNKQKAPLEPVTEEETVAFYQNGDERFEEYLPMLEGKRTALFSNQSGILLSDEEKAKEVGDGLNLFHEDAGTHVLDALIEQGVDVSLIFSPEHGFRGKADAGAVVDDSIDEKTGVPIVSLYGSDPYEQVREHEDEFDVILCDIQDVGLRFYTYYITMYKLMDVCAQLNKSFIMLDRINPNGFYVDGPLLKEEYRSGVGALEIPIVHGLTLGEMALMIQGEGWLSDSDEKLDLTVIPCLDYDHSMKVAIHTRPSPNLKDMRAIYLYPSLCLFENTVVSVGRGTEHPFEVYGSPYLKDLGYEHFFIPEDMSGAMDPVYEGEKCFGEDLRKTRLEKIFDEGIDLDYLINAYQRFHEQYPDKEFFGSANGNGYYWIDLLSGSDELRTMIIEGYNEDEIKEVWKEDIESFKQLRRKYLLYPEES